jgi:YfiH family protein
MSVPPNSWIVPDWPAPARVRALVTTRDGGVSAGPYTALNLGLWTGEDAQVIEQNRALLGAALPAAPVWMRQVHGTDVIDAGKVACGNGVAAAEPQADAAFATRAGVVCAVLTADCLPVLLCDREGGVVAVAHAGWRGLASGVIEATIGGMARPAGRLMAWLGPAISQAAYEVGPELREAFVSQRPADTAAFCTGKPGKFQADLYALARHRLLSAGVQAVYGGGLCTYGEPQRFYSYRRDGASSGRMASLIWLDS